MQPNPLWMIGGKGWHCCSFFISIVFWDLLMYLESLFLCSRISFQMCLMSPFWNHLSLSLSPFTHSMKSQWLCLHPALHLHLSTSFVCLARRCKCTHRHATYIWIAEPSEQQTMLYRHLLTDEDVSETNILSARGDFTAQHTDWAVTLPLQWRTTACCFKWGLKINQHMLMNYISREQELLHFTILPSSKLYCTLLNYTLLY